MSAQITVRFPHQKSTWDRSAQFALRLLFRQKTSFSMRVPRSDSGTFSPPICRPSTIGAFIRGSFLGNRKERQKNAQLTDFTNHPVRMSRYCF
jgi:hypothetical protein